MSRGTSRAKMVDAVLAGMCAGASVGEPLALAEALVRNAQPCRVDLRLELERHKGRAIVTREIRVVGVTGRLRATVLAIDDARPVAVTTALQLLAAARRRRAEGDVYRMLALPLPAEAGERDKLRVAVERELGARAAETRLVTGAPVEVAGRTVTPAVIVL